MTTVAYLNGEFCDLSQARVSIEDRGFQFGDGVYEVVETHNGRPFLLEDHMARLRRSLDAIDLPYDLDAHPLQPVIMEGLQRSGLSEAMVYIQITRGACARHHLAPEDLVPTVVMTFKPRPTIPDDLRLRGASVMTVRDERWALCRVKAITLLPNVLARGRAHREGYDDAVFVTGDGEVRELTSANLFVVKDGAIITPPRTESVLHGITQSFVMDCAEGIGSSVEERAFDVEFLNRADEVFMSSTTVEVLGITRVDGSPIGKGLVGPLTTRLHVEFQRRCAEMCAPLPDSGRATA
jgi:D-alanine transaminase